MFDLGQLFKRADTVQRHLAAPLARSRLAYLGHRAEQGAKPSTLRGIAALQINLVRYLELGEDGKVAPAEVEAAAQRWVSQDPARRGGDAEGIRRRFLSQATCWLRFAGRLQVPAAPSHPHATEVAVFVEHMRRERGWSEATIRYRRSRADEFLRRFCRGEGRGRTDQPARALHRRLNTIPARAGLAQGSGADSGRNECCDETNGDRRPQGGPRVHRAVARMGMRRLRMGHRRRSSMADQPRRAAVRDRNHSSARSHGRSLSSVTGIRKALSLMADPPKEP